MSRLKRMRGETSRLTTYYSYLITDYERSNFSLSQCQFEDGLPQKLITIKSTIPDSSPRNRQAIIGGSVGAAVLVLLLLLGLAIFLKKRRSGQNGGKDPAHSLKSDSSEWSISEKPPIPTVCEVDGGGFDTFPRELPDNGRYELQDEKALSGSGNEINELSPSLAFVAHELRTHRSSKESQVIESPTPNKFDILKSTEISRKSWPAPESSDGTPCIETVISASSRRSSSAVDVSSPSSSVSDEVSPISNSKARDLSSQKSITEGEPSPVSLLRSFDLDRSLPPTPISESPQFSPKIFGLSRVSSLRKGSQASSPLASNWRSPPFSPNIPSSKYSEALSRSRRRPMGSLKGLETAIPPGQSDTEGSGVSALSSEEPVVNTTWL